MKYLIACKMLALAAPPRRRHQARGCRQGVTKDQPDHRPTTGHTQHNRVHHHASAIVQGAMLFVS
jgi:hypothetical protein